MHFFIETKAASPEKEKQKANRSAMNQLAFHIMFFNVLE